MNGMAAGTGISKHRGIAHPFATQRSSFGRAPDEQVGEEKMPAAAARLLRTTPPISKSFAGTPPGSGQFFQSFGRQFFKCLLWVECRDGIHSYKTKSVGNTIYRLKWADVPDNVLRKARLMGLPKDSVADVPSVVALGKN
jgi:hypothetical protein